MPRRGRRRSSSTPRRTGRRTAFNTAAVAPDGSAWAGTMTLRSQPGHGSLYRIGADLNVTCAIGRIGLPKNCAWSPDGRRLYLSEGERGVLLAFDLDAGGLPGAPTVLLEGTPETGYPNGIACDAEGGIWVAMNCGWRVVRLLADGTVDRVIHLPVPMPTAVTLGGADLRTLFVTSTYLRLPPGFSTIAPRSGNLFSLPVDVPGQPPRRFGAGP